jgi:hypothetical protein
MAVDIFRNPTMKLPKSDQQIVRVDMEQDDLIGRKDHLPNQMKSDILSIQHVSSKGGK